MNTFASYYIEGKPGIIFCWYHVNEFESVRLYCPIHGSRDEQPSVKTVEIMKNVLRTR